MRLVATIRATFLGSAIVIGFGTAAFAEEVTADTVVARVGETEITVGQMIITRAQLPQQYQELPDDVLFTGVLDQLIQQQLLADALGETPARVTYAIENELRTLKAGEHINNLSRAAITEEAIQAAYDERFAGAELGTEYNASHLLVETEEEALAAKVRIDDGAEFADIARDVSTDPSGPNGGNLGWFGAGQMVAPFEEAVKAMTVGDVSDPVQTQFGWHIIKLNETREANLPPLDDLREELTAQLQEMAIQKELTTLTEATTVEKPEAGVFDPAILGNLDLLEPK